MKNTTTFSAVSLMLLVLGSQSPVPASTYTFQPAPPSPGGTGVGISPNLNDAGTLIGEGQFLSSDPFSTQQLFGAVSQNGQRFQFLPSPDVRDEAIFAPLAINNAGQIIGLVTNEFPEFPDPSLTPGITLLTGTTFTTVNIDNPTQFTPVGINNSGQIIGSYNNASDSILYSNGVVTSINFPGSVFTVATGINDSGEIVGYFSDGKTSHGFVDVDDKYTEVDAPVITTRGQTLSTSIAGVNDQGELAGGYGIFFPCMPGVGCSESGGFLDDGGNFSLFTQVDSILDVNDSGEVLARQAVPSGGSTIVVGFPSGAADVPEPGTFGLLLTGVFVASQTRSSAVTLRRRR